MHKLQFNYHLIILNDNILINQKDYHSKKSITDYMFSQVQEHVYLS